MVNISQQYLDATVNSLLNSVAMMASKAAEAAGQIADRDVTIAALRAEIETLKANAKDAPPPTT